MFALTPHRKDQPKTFSRQKELPRLPVPALDKSLERYIKSLRPLLLEQARQEGTGEASVEEGIRQREAWAKDFENGLGRLLQERLKGESTAELHLAAGKLNRLLCTQTSTGLRPATG